MKACLILIGLFALPLLASPLEYWTFDTDSSGDGLRDAVNSGSTASSWNFNTTTQGDVADGAGSFVLSGNSTTYTRKLPADPGYASPATTGIYLLEWDFTSWSVNTASVGDTVSFRVSDSSGNNAANLIWEVLDSTTVRVRASTYLSDTTQAFRNLSTYSLSEADGPRVGIEFDFDNDTVRYLLDGAEANSFSNFGATDIKQISLVKNGAWGTSATSVSINEMGLSAIPEPGTMLLLVGATASLLMWKRIRR